MGSERWAQPEMTAGALTSVAGGARSRQRSGSILLARPTGRPCFEGIRIPGPPVWEDSPGLRRGADGGLSPGNRAARGACDVFIRTKGPVGCGRLRRRLSQEPRAGGRVPSPSSMWPPLLWLQPRCPIRSTGAPGSSRREQGTRALSLLSCPRVHQDSQLSARTAGARELGPEGLLSQDPGACGWISSGTG